MVESLQETWVGGSTRQVQGSSQPLRDTERNSELHHSTETRQTLGTEQDRRLPAQLQTQRDSARKPQNHPQDSGSSRTQQSSRQTKEDMG